MKRSAGAVQEGLGDIVIPLFAVDRIDAASGLSICPTNEDAGLTLEDDFWRAFERSSP